MRKYIILFFSGLLLMFSCKKAPEGIIKPDAMANLLVQIHLADGAMAGIPQMPDSTYKYGMGRYLQIFKQFNTDSVQFRNSYAYYTRHPDNLVTIYDTVLRRLTYKSDSLLKIIAKNNAVMMKDNKPVVHPSQPVGPAVNRPGQMMPARPALPSNPVRPTIMTPVQKQVIEEKLRKRHDSLLKRNSNTTHAVPAK